MSKLDSTFLFSQARLNSSRLPKKMVRDFCGSTLFDIACKKLEEINLPPSQKWVSVYEDELLEIASNYEISVHYRSEESANCNDKPEVIWEICKHLPFSNYVLFNACLPLLKTSTIFDFFNTFTQLEESSLFGVSTFKDYLWGADGSLIHPKGTKMLNTKEFDEYPDRRLYKAAHCLYAGKTRNMMDGIQLGDFTVGNPAIYPINDKIELLDIDDEQDWIIAEGVFRNLGNKLEYSS